MAGRPVSRAGLPENRLPRSTSAGTITWQPDSARRRANLVLGPNPRLHSHQLPRGDVGIRQGDHLGNGRPVPGSNQQALRPQARHNVPTDPPDGHRIAFRQGRPSLGREELQPRRGPPVDHSDDLAETLPVGLDRAGVVGPGGEISLPESRSSFRRRLQATHQETVDPGHHASRQIAVPGQLGGAGKVPGLPGQDHVAGRNQ